MFSDLMVRTGLRLAEQTALTVFEMPLDRGLGGYQRFWLPASIAKGGSARRVYVPESAVGEAIAYAEIDRADVIEEARSAGRYRRWSHPFIVEDPNRPIARGPARRPDEGCAAGSRRAATVADRRPKRAGAGNVLVNRVGCSR